MELNKLHIGEWTPCDDGTYSIRLDKNSWYSSQNQDTIILLEYLIRQEQILKSIKNNFKTYHIAENGCRNYCKFQRN